MNYMRNNLFSNNMHIAFVTPSMFFGGAERVMSILINELTKRNYKISLIYLNDSNTIAYQLSCKVDIYYIKGVQFNKIKNFVLPINELRNTLKTIRPNVIVSFFNNTSCFSWLAQFGLKIPIVFSERNDPINNIKGLRALLFQKIALHTSTKIVFQTQGARTCYSSKGIQKKSTIIYNPLNLSEIEVSLSKNNYNIVSVGRLSSQKNQKLLIDAVAKLKNKYPKLTLTIYGEGNKRNALEQQIKDLGLINRIYLPGNETNVIDKISKSRMFVFSSDYEGIPNALLEAMSIGLPCVSTDCSPGGAREFIKNYENGILVPCNDTDAMANAIDFHLQNFEKSKLMAKNAMRINELLNINVIINKWSSLFDKI